MRIRTPLYLSIGVIAILTLALRAPSVSAPEPPPVPSELLESRAPAEPPPSPPRAPTTTPTTLPTAVPTATPTPIPALEAHAATGALTVTLTLAGMAPEGAVEAQFWYDTIEGHTLRSFPLGAARAISLSVTITPSLEVAPADWLAPDCAPDTTCPAPALDYWWLVRAADGTLARAGGTVTLDPQAAPQPAAAVVPEQTWVELATPHYLLRAMPGSDAARDLEQIGVVAEASFLRAADTLQFSEPVSVTVYLVPRVFWQGGVAYGSRGPLVISHLDRNYTGVAPWSYLVHEVTHALGGVLLPDNAEVGGLLGEGIAVHASGGHYTIEPVDRWAAALVESGQAVPLCSLRYDFYIAQHETAYLQAASYSAYLLRTYGQETFLAMYRLQQAQRGDRESDRSTFCEEDDQQIAAPLGKTNLELEEEWLESLQQIEYSEEDLRAVELRIRLFETLRTYEELLDPPARFLPPPPEDWDARTWELIATPARGQRAAAIETLLSAAGQAIGAGELERASMLLDAADGWVADGTPPDLPLAQDHAALIELLSNQARALRMGDRRALADTLADAELGRWLPLVGDAPIVDLRYDLARLEVRNDQAEALVEVRGRNADGRELDDALFVATFRRAPEGWRMDGWRSYQASVELPPPSSQ